METADLDGDGDLDAFSASRLDGQVRWYRNEGNAAAFTPALIDVVNGAYFAIAGDVDADGDVDLMVAAVAEVRPAALVATDGVQDSGAPGAVLWYENDGQSPPAFQRNLIFGDLHYPVSLHAADLDSDGDLDILSASRDDNHVRWYENDGNGADPGFQVHTLSDTMRAAVSVHAADFNGDGDLDVVAASEDDDQIAWFENDGARPPQFWPHVIRRTTLPIPLEFDYAKSVHGADVDGDGDQDIVYGSEQENLIGWYENLGGPSPNFVQHTVGTEADHAKFVTAADVDLDGDMDLLVASTGDQSVAWYENDGERTPTFRSHLITASALGARHVHVADLDGDGDMDLLTASRDDNRIAWYQNRTIHRSAFFSHQAVHPIADTVVDRAAAIAVASGDLDNDGDQDVVGLTASGLAWHENRGNETPAFQSVAIAGDVVGGQWAHVADLDRDGDGDILFVAANTAGTGERIGWYVHDGRSPPQFAQRAIDAGAGSVHVAEPVDLDNDGDLDLVAAWPDAERLLWYENNGQDLPDFTAHVVDGAPGAVHALTIADLNGDARLDVAVLNENGAMLTWYAGQPVGSQQPLAFVRRTPSPVMTGAQRDDEQANRRDVDDAPLLRAADLDRDGKVDLISAGSAAGSLLWHQNLGDPTGSFQPRVIEPTLKEIRTLEVQDLDQDGDLDLVLVNGDPSQPRLIWYENNGQSRTSFARQAVEDIAVDRAVIAEMDGDGDGDLVTVSGTGLAWLENQGGQYALTARTGVTEARDGRQPTELASYTVAHRGRRGDPLIQLTQIEVLFRDASGQALNSQQIQSCIARLYVYRDVCRKQRFAPSEIGLLATVAPLILDDQGRLIIELPENSPYRAIWPQDERLLFLAGDLAAECALSPGGFSMAYWVDPETVRDATTAAPLVAEAHGGEGEIAPDALASAPALFINEVGSSDMDGAPAQTSWIEIYNAEFVEVSLSGMYLTNDPADPTRYRIPEGITVPARGHRIFLTDGNAQLGAAHTNFSLNAGVNTLAIYNSDAWGRRLIDRTETQMPDTGRSRGRYPDGAQGWTDLLPSPARYNRMDDLPIKTFLPLAPIEISCPG